MLELKGSVVPLVTPMTHDGQIDYLALKRLVSWHVEASTNALVVLGSSGEGTLLSPEENADVIRFVIEDCACQLPVWVGVSDLSISRVNTAIHQAATLGADGVMLASPMYVKPSQEGIIRYFTEIADASELNILLYNVPSRTANHIDVETACVLSHHEKIIGIKDCDITNERMRQYQEASHDFEVFSGDDSEILTCIFGGGAGVVSVLGNIIPEIMTVACDLAALEHFQKAEALCAKWASFVDVLNQLPNPVAIKWVMAKRGMISPYTRLPLVPLNFDQESLLQDAMSDMEPLLNLNPEFVAFSETD
ncbi:MAG: 4-hydroxy-tetrahydrodipicolinate synthase [Pseudomonadota bacterium]|nr:4-hydroxy-tetrahydrodipicolinate synthase [Pseudomonadota bacterium]